jgi:hypothetical protein
LWFRWNLETGTFEEGTSDDMSACLEAGMVFGAIGSLAAMAASGTVGGFASDDGSKAAKPRGGSVSVDRPWAPCSGWPGRSGGKGRECSGVWLFSSAHGSKGASQGIHVESPFLQGSLIFPVIIVPQFAPDFFGLGDGGPVRRVA